MHLEYGTYMFVFASLGWLQVLAQGAGLHHGSPPRDGAMMLVNLDAYTLSHQARNAVYIAAVPAVCHGQACWHSGTTQGQVMQGLTGQTRAEQSELPQSPTKLRVEGDNTKEEAGVLYLEKRKRSPSPRRRRQRPHGGRDAREVRDSRDRRDYKDVSCDEEWEWDEEARRYFQRENGDRGRGPQPVVGQDCRHGQRDGVSLP